MEIPKEKTPSVRKSTPQRMPSRDNSAMLSSTQDNFFKKCNNSKGFITNKGDVYGTIIQIMKSDLFQIQEMIKEYSHTIKMYKLMSKSSNITKKLSEIEEMSDIKSVMEKIIEDSENIEKTGRIYNCNESNELIRKLTLEMKFYELILKKITEYFFLLHLKTIGDDNLHQDSFSKILVIKLVIEKLIEKANSTSNQTLTNTNEQDLKAQIDLSLLNDKNVVDQEDDKNIIQEYNKLLGLKSLNELNAISSDSSNKLASHFNKLIKDFLDKLNTNYSDMLYKYSGKKFESLGNGIQIDNFLTQKLLIEKLIIDKDNENSKLVKELKSLKESNKSLENDMFILKKEIENHKTENLSQNELKLTEDPSNSVKSLLKLLDESN
jgi:hypothetical protein